MSNAVRNAAIYCRISRDAEGEGLGVARQEEACRELADRLGLPVDAATYSFPSGPRFDIAFMGKRGPASIVTPELIREVSSLHASGLGTRRIAKKLAIARGTVFKALRASVGKP